ncbi:hypothetical protein BDP27DRAFT_1428114 [Rhodocollybia butyracea]|uniref:Uncharacterized protein n=1 Tax=Rhodocollybia butyracea TaxID=206335 RepID=A0A9P5PHN0_9AGAR|nr:hypothetical protein BDP27DRAFT_1428114 [Rhodocollybia butyracea]
MTPEEVDEISAAGFVFMHNIGLNIILTSTLLGMYCLAFYISLYIYMKKRNAGGAKKAMLCVLLCTFILMLMFFVSTVGSLFEHVVSLPHAIKQSQGQIYETIISWLSNIIALIADSVIAWRAWAVWMDNKKVKWTLLVLILADIGITLSDGAVDESVLDHHLTINAIPLDCDAFVLSLSVNVIATSLIAFRAWMHHKSMTAISISIKRKRSKAEAILLLLVESGAIYALLQLLVIIMNELEVKKGNVSIQFEFATAFTVLVYEMAAILNPVAIFILVQTDNTYEQSFHLEEILTLSQPPQSQHTSGILNDPEGTPDDAGHTDQETDMIGIGRIDSGAGVHTAMSPMMIVAEQEAETQ